MKAARKPLDPAPARGTQKKVPMTIWLDPVDRARVNVLARRRDDPPTVFARKALLHAVSVTEMSDGLGAQAQMRRL